MFYCCYHHLTFMHVKYKNIKKISNFCPIRCNKFRHLVSMLINVKPCVVYLLLCVNTELFLNFRKEETKGLTNNKSHNSKTKMSNLLK